MDDRRRCRGLLWCTPLICGGLASALHGQSPELKLVMDRLDRLEAQNRELLQEVKALKQQLASVQTPATPALEAAPLRTGSRPYLTEQLEVNERRIAGGLIKVSTDHRSSEHHRDGAGEHLLDRQGRGRRR